MGGRGRDGAAAGGDHRHGEHSLPLPRKVSRLGLTQQPSLTSLTHQHTRPPSHPVALPPSSALPLDVRGVPAPAHTHVRKYTRKREPPFTPLQTLGSLGGFGHILVKTKTDYITGESTHASFPPSLPLHPSLPLSRPSILYLHNMLSLHAPSGDFYHCYLVILYPSNGLDLRIFLSASL